MLTDKYSSQGANFRDLKGVCVKDNKVYLDPEMERPKVKSGKPLVNILVALPIQSAPLTVF